MTTDAKIGLLLGLVFIVIIAFVINGLPSFHKSPSTNDLTKDYVTGVGSKPIGLPTGQGFDPADNEGNVVSPPIASAPGKSGPQEQSSITQVNNPIEVPMPLKEAEVAVGPVRTEQDGLTPSDISSSEPGVVASGTGSGETPTEASAQKSTVYVVKRGDNLGLIAQNCYGTQGAKKENVTKIIKANRLKSSGQIYVGQKLVIPSPTILSDTKPSMFDTVTSMGKSLVSSETPKEDPTSNKGLRDYVVKKDDNPYKIASKELGSGIRYKEIFKCNPGITEKTILSVGMHLKLPQR